MKVLKVFFIQAYLSFQALFGWARPLAYFFVKILNPIFQLSFFCIMAKVVYNTSEIERYVLGNSIVLCSYNCVFGLGRTLSQERYFGTLKSLIVSPSNNSVTYFQRCIIHIFDSLLTVSVAMIAGVILFQADFTRINFMEFILLLIVGIFSASSLGLLLASLGLFLDNLNMMLNIFAMFFLAFTGANYPLEKLPIVLRLFSMCLPLTRSISLGDSLLEGNSLVNRWDLLLGEFIIGVIYTILGYYLFRVCEKIARRKGNLDIY